MTKHATQGRAIVAALKRRPMNWVPIPGWPNHEVSDVGLVRRARSGAVLSLYVNRGGYATLRISHDAVAKTVYVHQLVALAFIGARPPMHQVRHLDGDRLNNCRENIAYGTAAENSEDKRRHGTHLFGDRHANAKLKDVQVLEALRLAKVTNLTAAADAYGVCVSTLSMVRQGRNRRHLASEIAAMNAATA